MSTIIDVTAALVARLNAGEFSQSFTAERKYQPVFELPELAELRVSVVPKAVIIATAFFVLAVTGTAMQSVRSRSSMRILTSYNAVVRSRY